MKRIIVLLSIVVYLIFANAYVNAATFEDNAGKDEIPYGEFGIGFKPYQYKSFNMMTEEEAAVANVPTGYSGYVLELTGGSGGVGIALDIKNIRVNDIENITFRIYCPEGTKSNGVRLTNTASNTWIMLASPGNTDKWVEVVLDDKEKINELDNGNGYCKDTNFCIRYEGDNKTVYIDSITVNLKAPDTVPPVIKYTGENKIITSAERRFTLDLTVYDEYEERNITPEFIWSDGAIDSKGYLVEGTHTCTIRAKDFADNCSEITLIVEVKPKDIEAPIINFVSEEICVPVGTRPRLSITATDNIDKVGTELSWSDGALDARGRLCEGEHTLTITTKDDTGNESMLIVKIHVSNESIVKGNLIEETLNS